MYYNSEDFYDSIDIGYFDENSNTNIINYKLYDKILENSILKNIKGTYFEWIPYEMIRKIISISKKIHCAKEVSYYDWYFNKENTKLEILRYLRWKPQKPTENLPPGIVTMFTELGSTLGKKIFFKNSSLECYEDFSKIIECGLNNIEGIRMLDSVLKNRLIWLVDHSYTLNWSSLIIVTLKKIYDSDNMLDDIINNKKESKLNKNDRDEAKNIFNDLKYFIEYYLPYALLSRSDNYYLLRFENNVPLDSYHQSLFDIYEITGIHPNTINIEEAYEYEMSIYDPDYYYDIYSKYMVLRNGKRLIPKGSIPKFYWCGNEYIRAFI